MYKKQQLVTSILESIEKAHVVLDAKAQQELRVADSNWYWNGNPDGHCNFDDTVEEVLSCLTEMQLQKIIDLTTLCGIKEGAKFRELWREWGQQGVFDCKPEVLTTSAKVPILRIRHDCYLHWMRGFCFQNSYDSHCNGSNGSSGSTLEQDVRIVTIPAYSNLWEKEDEGVDVAGEWNEKWALFRKAMILAHPFLACVGKASFYSMLDRYPTVFEEFFNQTDENVMRLGLSKELTVERIKEQCSSAQFSGPTIVELAVILKNPDSHVATLRYGAQAVQLSWNYHGAYRQMTIQFPAWDKDSYVAEMWECADWNACSPMQACESSYLYNIWCNLTAVLLTFAGLTPHQFGINIIKGRDFTITPVMMYPEEARVSCLSDVWSELYEVCEGFYTFKKLVHELSKQ